MESCGRGIFYTRKCRFHNELGKGGGAGLVLNQKKSMGSEPDVIELVMMPRPLSNATWKDIDRWLGHKSWPDLERKRSVGESTAMLRRLPSLTACEFNIRD